jgi:SNF2 family DNA or RNA helicase
LSQSLRRVKADVCRYILTGTPVQNSLEELWSLYDWIFEGRLLGSKKTFKSQFESKIVRASEKDASVYEIKLGREISRKLRELIEPHFLRREKSVVLKDNAKVTISNKNDLVMWIRNTDHQLNIYSEFLDGDMVRQVLKNSECVLAAITYLKQICSHPDLLKTEEKSASVSKMIKKSGKMSVLNSILKQLFQVESDQDHKLLLFSQSTCMLDMIEDIMRAHDLGFLRIDGSISDSRERQRLIDTFNDPDQDAYQVFLLTSQVGGVGITLTAADRVIIYDSSWNPAIDVSAFPLLTNQMQESSC